ncbi:methylenetetrahydrofolate reductase [Rhizobacter sp. Root1221]|uniref:methylenetetrahydrofolate reductase n=1 Tax=Rhizobacter sp. Root1221 TaxID=1736433 RepID=UPI0006F4EE2B|nr:methylenetetrahydrofolate reductase [Rhizobacter sp. Root1221]KQV91549.1 5,10-methylenetetrahydrofolate reductase [Rhizobacter sp. Root1221]
MTSNFPVSLEFFPAKTPDGVAKYAAVRRELYALKPAFCSVTAGAGGSTHKGTLSMVQDIFSEGVEGAPHFTCVGASTDSIRDALAQFRDAGIRRIVALRGDLPSGYGSFGEFRYASDLVAFIRAETGDHFHIEVAAYPEMHPQAKSPQADLQAYAAKVHAGANSAITQLFFNADAYFRFLDEARKLGADVPVVPGVMPITNASGLIRFADNTGAEIPRWIRLRLQSYGDDVESIKAFGLDVVTDLCERLRAGGAPGVHLYTMNQSGASLALFKRLGW